MNVLARLPASMRPTEWRVGEHVVVIGTTGTGKTYLVSKLVELREFVIVLRTKSDNVAFPGFRTFRTAKPIENWQNTRVIIEPKYEDQAKVAADLMERVWQMKGWTLVIDEGWYAEHQLGLKFYMERLLTQGRSKGISVVTGVQRPAWVSRFVFSESSHVFSFRVDGRDLKTVREVTSASVEQAVHGLRRFGFVHYHSTSRDRNGQPIIRTGNAKKLNEVLRNVPFVS